MTTITDTQLLGLLTHQPKPISLRHLGRTFDITSRPQQVKLLERLEKLPGVEVRKGANRTKRFSRKTHQNEAPDHLTTLTTPPLRGGGPVVSSGGLSGAPPPIDHSMPSRRCWGDSLCDHPPPCLWTQPDAQRNPPEKFGLTQPNPTFERLIFDRRQQDQTNDNARKWDEQDHLDRLARLQAPYPTTNPTQPLRQQYADTLGISPYPPKLRP